METTAWHQFFGTCDSLSREAVADSLKGAGIAICTIGDDGARGPGILFFDKIEPGLCESIRELSHHGLQRVLAVAASRTVMSDICVWSLLHAGASDVLAWDGSPDPAGEVAARFERWIAVDQLVSSPLVLNSMIGKSPAWISAMRRVVEVARFTSAPVLIMGESGTGKELAARLIHSLDPRTGKDELVVLDCTTIVPSLAGSEFFGHERGAFTGAVNPRDGAFALANGGTLFLDEVGELPLDLQAQLLRVAQEGTYKRVGGNNWTKTNFRLVCATNKDLLNEVGQGKFRHDLYYRIATWTCRLPPLRDRADDVLRLVDHFLKEFGGRETNVELDDSVREHLLRRDYPGNVRDLKQLVTRIAHRHVGPGPITVGGIPEEERPRSRHDLSDWRSAEFRNAICRALSSGVGLKEIGRAAEETAVHVAVHSENGNLQGAARKLGVTDRALQMRRAAKRQQENDGGES